MASYPTQECRPLKRPRLGTLGPDVYPQEPKQKEDELNVTNVKHGFQHQTFDDEYKTAKEKIGDLTEERINKFFLSVINEKKKINTVPEQGKKKLGQNIRDIFWLVTQGSKVEPWLKDLAGTKPLTVLSKKCPIFNKKEDIYKNLCDHNVPMKRAVWFIKMTNSYHTALAEARVRYRGRAMDPLTEWAQVTKDFLKSHLQKIIDHYQGNSMQSLTVPSILDPSMKYWTYGTQLAKHLYEEGLLERHEFLTFFLEQLEKHKITDDTVLKLILGQILRYMSEYVQSQLLARRLASFCCQKIASFCQDSGCPSPRTQSPALTTTPNGTVSTASGNPPVTPQGQSGVASLFKEYNSCPQHRGLILSMCAMVQSISLRCPGSLVWHCHGEGKMSSPLSGSPLDALPCAPACLPMPPGLDNDHLRAQLRVCEDQIRMRSRMSESRWSSDKCQQSAKVFGMTIREGFTISKILQVLDKLDRQNFAKIEIHHFLDNLYTEVFGVLQSKENEPPISDEPIVNLLCEWAVSTQRTGEYRALIVAKLLERRQAELTAEKYPEDDLQEKSSDVGSELGEGRVPEFQGLLLSFLDNQAPYLDDSPSADTKQAFCNLIHLFSELINHDVFSHDAYMCTLISRGDLSDAATMRQHAAITLDITGEGGESVRSHKAEDSKMEVDRHHMDTDFDIFAFKDDAKPSPGQPASVKSIGPFSVPTPGQAQTPMPQSQGQSQAHTPGMARTPGGPTTPLGMGARTPGNPHTPGAHTPGKATTPIGAGGLTPGMAHTPGLTPGGPTTPSRTPVHGGGPHTPGIVAYLSGSGSHHSGMGHTPRASQTQGQPGACHVTQNLTGEDSALRAKKHLCYATHFPIPQDEFCSHECNQRFMMLYGVGKARDEARHVLKKINKEIMKLFGKKNSLDVTSGEVKKKEKKKEKGGVVTTATTSAVATETKEATPETATNYESTRAKFMRLNYHDQHTLTYHCSNQVLESIKSFCTGASQYLPLIENVCYLCDLMELCYNVNVLVEFLVELLKELPEVDTQLMKKGSSLEGHYTTTLCLCVVAVLRKYHAYLLVTNELTCSVFESLCNIVKHVGNPADCTSAERCILAYLYDLFTTSYHVKTKFQELFSGASAKVKAALFATVTPSVSNQEWDNSIMAELVENPGLVINRQRLESQFVSQILEPANRYSFVCNIINSICNCQSVERLNELAILSAELTSMCNLLSCEWLGVLKALCCSANTSALSQGNKDMAWASKNYGFMDILFQIDLNDHNVHDSLTVFVSLLVARHCLSLDDIIMHVAMPSLLRNTSLPTDSEAEQGARLTCHLLLRLFQTAHLQAATPGANNTSSNSAVSGAGSNGGMNSSIGEMTAATQTADSNKNQMYIKSSTDKHLLDAAHEACDLDAIVAVLKVLILLSDTVVPTTKKNTDSGGDLIQTLLKSLDDDDDDDDLDLDLGLPGVVSKKGVEQAGLSEYARHILKEICSQSWLREKFLKDPEALLTSDLLLDNALSHKQAQQLVHLICYPEGVPSPPPIDEDLDDIPEQRRYISRILNNMDQWKLRVSLLELQLMFKQAPASEMSALLDNVSKATIEVFTQQTEKRHGEVPSQSASWSDPEKELIWLIAPLISKLSSTAQGRVLRAAGEKLKTGNNFWTAKNASEKESYLKESISLMGHQPFLSLVLTCLKGQDEQREGLLKSLYEQLEKFVNNTKEPQDRGIPTDDRLKLMMQESLRLRMSLVGGMFDTIQRSNTLLNEWATILIQLVSCGVVSLSNNAELFMVVLDMFSVLLHGTLVPDPVEGKDDRRTYSGLVRKLKKEIGEKKNESMDLVKQLIPLSKVTVDVLVNEPHKVKKQQGFQLGGKLNTKISPWELLEGHKNPAPLSLSYFGAVRVERKPAKYEEEHRLLLYHTHSLKKPQSHYLDPPPLPPEDLEPSPMERKEDKLEMKVVNQLGDDGKPRSRSGKRTRPRSRTPTGSNHMPPVGPAAGFSRPGMYDQPGAPAGWQGGYGVGNPAGAGQQHQNYMPQPLQPGGPRMPQPGMGPRTGKEAIERLLAQGRGANTSFMPHSNMHGNMMRVPRSRPLRGGGGSMMHGMAGGGAGGHMGEGGAMYQGGGGGGGGMGGMPGYTGGAGAPMQPGMGGSFGPGGYQQQPIGPMEPGINPGGPNMPTGSYSRAYPSGQGGMGSMSNMQGMPANSQGQFMGGQGQMNHPNRFSSMGMPSTTISGMVGSGGGQMGGYNSSGYAGMNQQQQRIQQMRQQQFMMQQQQQQQQPSQGQSVGAGGGGGGATPQGMQASQQQTAALINQLHRQMSNNPGQGGQGGQQAPPPQYGNYSRGQY